MAKKSCCSACAKGRPCCSRSNPSKGRALTAAELSAAKGQIQWLVGNMHVGTTDEDVESNIRQRLAKARISGEPLRAGDVNKIVAHALKVHHDNQKLYSQVMWGRR